MGWETAIIMAFVAMGAIYLYRQRRIENNVRNIVKETMPLWASFAPFKDGHDSATTMYYCEWATQGKKLVDGLEKRNAYKGHADSFDGNPGEWEKLIKQSTETHIDDLEKKRRLVVSLFELDRKKKEGKLPDWNSYNALGYIITSPENEAANKYFSLLQHLMETNSSIEIETSNLMEDYVVYTDREIDKNLSAGFLCYVCLKYAGENPHLDISKEIVRMKDKTFEDHKVKNGDKPQ